MKDNTFLDMMKTMGQKSDEIPETTKFIDTGSYILNALISSSIYGGFPCNRVTALAGEQGTYKSFFAMSAVKQFQKDNPEGGVIYYDTEYALDKTMMENRGIDVNRIVVLYPETLQDFRNKALNFITGYEKIPEKERQPILLILDSLGNLPSAKELTDAQEGKDVRDMTRTQIIRSIFRTITLKLGLLDVPMIVTNHTYTVIGCLDETQNIIMHDDTVKNIKDIQVGDSVKTLDGPKNVSDLFEYDVSEYVELGLSDGRLIKATPEHKFYVARNEWVTAEDLEIGEVLTTSGIVLDSWALKKDKIKVYDFTVDDAHHYILDNSVISHNSYVPTRAMCLTKDTKIVMQDGMTKNIQDIRLDDMAMTTEGPKPVDAVFSFETEDNLYEIEFEDGLVIRCTEDHKFSLIKDDGQDFNWVEAKLLVAGDDLENVLESNS